jgi:predicted kinase
MDDDHQIHLERYQEVLDDRRSALGAKRIAAAQAVDWAVIEQAASQRLTSKQLAILEAHELIGRGAHDLDQRRKALADLNRRLDALDALIEAVHQIAHERRNR